MTLCEHRMLKKDVCYCTASRNIISCSQCRTAAYDATRQGIKYNSKYLMQPKLASCYCLILAERRCWYALIVRITCSASPRACAQFSYERTAHTTTAEHLM